SARPRRSPPAPARRRSRDQRPLARAELPQLRRLRPRRPVRRRLRRTTRARAARPARPDVLRGRVVALPPPHHRRLPAACRPPRRPPHGARPDRARDTHARCPPDPGGQRRLSRLSLRRGLDVVVDPEQIGWIVLGLSRLQPRIVLAERSL